MHWQIALPGSFDASVCGLRFVRDCRGVTAVEYGLIAAGIAAVIVGAMMLLADDIGAMFQEISTGVGQAVGG